MPVYDALKDTYNNTKYGSSTYNALNDYIQEALDFVKNTNPLKNKEFAEEAKAAGMSLADYYMHKIEGYGRGVVSGMANGQWSGTDVLNAGAAYGVDLSNNGAVANQIAQDNATQAYNRELEARDTSLASQVEQLKNLGMNPGSVVTMGGANMPSVAQASSPKASAVQKFDNKAHVLGSVLNLVGRLGQGAIYGATRSFLNRSIGPMARSTMKTAKQAVMKPDFDQKFYDSLPDDWEGLMQML